MPSLSHALMLTLSPPPSLLSVAVSVWRLPPTKVTVFEMLWSAPSTVMVMRLLPVAVYGTTKAR